MRCLILSVLIGLGVLPALSKDLVIFRTGDEYTGSISEITPKEITFKPDILIDAENVVEQNGVVKLDPAQLYLVKIEGRGNYYFNSDGKRMLGEMQDRPDDVDAIYLLSGREILSYRTVFSGDKILAQTQKKKFLKKSAQETEILAQDIFFIRYKDGRREFFNELEVKQIEEEQPAPEPKQEIKVKLYTTVKGDTLIAIAQKNNVTVDQLKEWNEFPAGYAETKKFPVGEQIMIYVIE